MGKVYLPRGGREFTGGFQAGIVVLRGIPLIELKMRTNETNGNLYVYLDEGDLASLDCVRQSKRIKLNE